MSLSFTRNILIMTCIINVMITSLNTFTSYIVLGFSKFWYLVDLSFRKKYSFIEREIELALLGEVQIGVPSQLKNLIILIEDKRFETHKGVDFYSIIRAAYKTIFGKRLEGASTLTQQLVRIITNEREIAIKRKLQEISLSLLITRKYSKADVFAAYIILYPISKKIIGIPNYCKGNNINIQSITTTECYDIITRLKYPNLNIDNKKYISRYNLIKQLHTKKTYAI